MPTVDWIQLGNLIVSGFIGLVFGVIGGYATYRFQRHRDELQWQHDKEKMEMTWQQKLQELEIQFLRQDQQRLRDDILRGIDNPTIQIANFSRGQTEMRMSTFRDAMDAVLKAMEIYPDELVLDKIETLLTDLQQQKLLAPEMSEKKEISVNDEEKADS